MKRKPIITPKKRFKPIVVNVWDASGDGAYVPRDGFGPFSVQGERFAIMLGDRLDGRRFWRATHINTGVSVGETMCDKKEDVPAKLRKFLKSRPPGDLQRAIKATRERLNAQMRHANTTTK